MDKRTILENVKQYYQETFATKEYRPGDRINYGGRVFDENELCTLVDSALDFWLTAGRFNESFENGLAEYLDVPFCATVNSGSSANLLALTALTSPLLGSRAVQKGDEIITVAAAFPTTVAPIVQIGAVPVFVDISIPSYNIDSSQLENALSEKTKAVVLAHSLGNPFNLKEVKNFCDKHGLWLIEDNCDALGAEYTLDGIPQKTGTVGDIGTSSFYPAHHITMGEGGAVYTKSPLLNKILRSFRDWGRDCVCTGGQDNRCNKRFSGQYGSLPYGYDHKYVYSHLGYNLKITDMQAAVGCAQLKKLPSFVEKRRSNWRFLRDELTDIEDILILPEEEPNACASWFGFILCVRPSSGKTREKIVSYIEQHNIQTRNLFAGNIVRHPCFENLKEGMDYRIAGKLDQTDLAMNNSFWVGVYPGMTQPMLDEMVRVIRQSVR